MKLILTLALISTMMSAAGQVFPSLSAEQADGKVIDLPAAFKGKKAILFMAFTPAAENMLDNWYGPVYTMFIDKSGFNAMAYDCHLELMMMFTGASQAAAEKVKSKIRDNIDGEMADHLLFYEGNFKEEMKELGMQKKNDAYVVVLDEKGNVLTIETGTYSEKKLEKIASLVEL